MTWGGRRAILPALMRMRHLAVGLLALLAVPLAGCGNSCQDLGNRICACTGSGTTADTCRQQIQNLLKDTGVHSSDSAFCAARLGTCQLPASATTGNVATDVKFCEWINTACGKVQCGLANRDPADVVTADPATAVPLVCRAAP